MIKLFNQIIIDLLLILFPTNLNKAPKTIFN